jgi:hypothetical protein
MFAMPTYLAAKAAPTVHKKTGAGVEWHLLKPRTTVIPAQAGIQTA